jgi:exosortase/archaeosortase family protein
LAKNNEFKGKAFGFTLKFFIIFALLYALLFMLDFSIIENWLASLEAGFLGIQAFGNQVQVGEGLFAITESCIGLFSGIVLAAIVFACKKPSLKLKAGIAVLGIALLFLINILRVYFVLLAGKAFGIQAAELVHVASWLAMTAIIIGTWYYLTKKISGKKFEELI